jgi:CheY-like chemotaxis protein
MASLAKHILVVDDCQSLRAAIEFGLAKAGFRVTTAADATEAMELVANHRFDLIISDYMMPGLTGTDLIKRLRSDSRYATTPMIMLTARADELNVPQISDDLVVLFRRKPCSLDAMVNTVSKCLDVADCVC